jgi:Mg2+-importing ATPase
LVMSTQPSHNLPFWTQTADALGQQLSCGREGLSQTEAAQRLGQFGPNLDIAAKRISPVGAIIRRLLEPLSLILLVAAIVSTATGDKIGGSIIAAILIFSIGLDTLQEGQAVRAADILRRSVALKAEVKRDGVFTQIGVEDVVPGDVMRVRAGDIIPADGLVLEGNAFTANEAALTGEPYPVEKRPGMVTGTTASEASNALFRGAVAQTGYGSACAGRRAIAISEGLARIWIANRAPDNRTGSGRAGDQCVFRSAGAPVFVVCGCAGCRSYTRVTTNDHDGDAVTRCDAHGKAKGHRQTASLNSRPWCNDHLVH